MVPMVRRMTTATVVVGSSRSQRLVLSSGERTWTVLGEDHRMVEPAQEYLEYLRAQQASPNTVKSYARALALWWQYLDAFGLRWDAVTLADFGAFLTWLRAGDAPGVVSIERRAARFAESTIAARLRAVISCYDYHVLNGLDVGRDLHRITHHGGSRYKPLLEHIARRKGRRQAVIGVRHCRQGAPPILTPQQIERIYEACASWDNQTREWRGSVRNRLLWMLLAETGFRLGETLGCSIATGTPGGATSRSSRSWPETTRPRCGPRAATGACMSPTSWTASMATRPDRGTRRPDATVGPRPYPRTGTHDQNNKAVIRGTSPSPR